MKRLIALFLIVLSLALGILYLTGTSQADIEADLLVFGAPPGEEGKLNPTLENRGERAAKYLLEHDGALAILLGGGEPLSEARALADYLVSRGIDEDRLVLEEESTSTWTNLLGARKLMGEMGIERALACSSDYHQFRIGFLSRRLEMELYPLPVKTPWRMAIFSYSREIFAIIKSFFLDC